MLTIDQLIAQYISEKLTVNGWPLGNLVLCIIAILLSVVLCGAIGIERERRGRSAGLRTHLLVGVGSCIIMIISIYGFPQVFESHRDPARLAAQVIAGVGFLGAGAIIHRNAGIRGLTTAATVWITMAIGIACGSMNFILALVGTGTILLVLTAFRKFEARINQKSPLVLVRANKETPIVSVLLDVAEKFGCNIHDLQVESGEEKDVEVTFLAVANPKDFKINEFVAALEKTEGVVQVGVLNGHKY